MLKNNALDNYDLSESSGVWVLLAVCLNDFLTNMAITRLSGWDGGGPRTQRVCSAPVTLFSGVCVCVQKEGFKVFVWLISRWVHLSKAAGCLCLKREGENKRKKKWRGGSGVMFSQRCYIAKSGSFTNTKTLLGDAGNNTLQKKILNFFPL